MANRMKEETIFDMIASPEKLEARYPHDAEGWRWAVVVIKMHERALEFAERLSALKIPVLLFNMYGSTTYAVAAYTLDYKVMASDFVMRGYSGTEQLHEMGQDGIHYNCIGAWNFGGKLPQTLE